MHYYNISKCVHHLNNPTCCHVQIFKAVSRNKHYQSAAIDLLQNAYTSLIHVFVRVLYIHTVAFHNISLLY